MSEAAIPDERVRQWRSTFSLLTIRSAVPLWTTAGVPRAFILEPVGLMSAAREFVRGFYVLAPSTGRETPAQAALLAQTWNRLRSEYGDANVVALRTWAERFDVDRVRRTKWSDWRLALNRLGEAFPGVHSRLPAPIDPHVRELAETIIRRRIGPEHSAALDELRARAEASRPSELEMELLAPAPEPMLTVAEGLGAVLDGLESISASNATYQTLGELRGLIRTDEWAAFEVWATAEVRTLRTGAHIPVNLDLSAEFTDASFDPD